MLVKAGWIVALSLGMFGKRPSSPTPPFRRPRNWSERDSSVFWLLSVAFLLGVVVIFWAL